MAYFIVCVCDGAVVGVDVFGVGVDVSVGALVLVLVFMVAFLR